MRVAAMAMVALASACGPPRDGAGDGGGGGTGVCGFQCSTDGGGAGGGLAPTWRWENPTPRAEDWNAVWASSDRDIWVAGAASVTLRGDGTQWRLSRDGTVSNSWGTIYALAGASESQLFAGDGSGWLHRWNGTAWSLASRDFGTDIRALWVASPRAVWAGGGQGRLRFWNGSEWTDPPRTGPFYAADTYQAVFGLAVDDVYAVAARGSIVHWDGAALREVRYPDGLDLRGVWGAAPDDVWAAGVNGALLHFDGTDWVAVTSPTPYTLRSIHGRASNDVWAAGEYGAIIHYDGVSWAVVPSDTTNTLCSVFASGTRVWAVGAEGEILVLANGRFVLHNGIKVGTLRGIASESEADTWVVGDHGATLHFDGAAWSSVPNAATENTLRDAWSASFKQVWAVGDEGTIVRWDGSAWSALASGVPHHLHGVWGANASDVFVVGYAGTVLRWNGASLERMPFPTTDDLVGIAGTTSDDVWAIGGTSVFHFDGNSWAVSRTTLSQVRAIVMHPSGRPWVMSEGMTSKWDGTSWNDRTDFSTSAVGFDANGQLRTIGNLNDILVGRTLTVERLRRVGAQMLAVGTHGAILRLK